MTDETYHRAQAQKAGAMANYYSRAATEYDPFDDDVEARREELELRDARREHELWSLAQSRAGKSALDRSGEGTWIKPPDLEAIDQPNKSGVASSAGRR